MAIDSFVVGRRLRATERISRLHAVAADIADRVATREHYDSIEPSGSIVALYAFEIVIEPKEPMAHVCVVAWWFVALL